MDKRVDTAPQGCKTITGVYFDPDQGFAECRKVKEDDIGKLVDGGHGSHTFYTNRRIGGELRLIAYSIVVGGDCANTDRTVSAVSPEGKCRLNGKLFVMKHAEDCVSFASLNVKECKDVLKHFGFYNNRCGKVNMALIVERL